MFYGEEVPWGPLKSEQVWSRWGRKMEARVSHSDGLESWEMFEGNLGWGEQRPRCGWGRARGCLVLRGIEIQQICGGCGCLGVSMFLSLAAH